jgi:hypothetical protein
MKRFFRKFKCDDKAAVTVETSLLIMVLIVLTGGSIEAGYAFYQYNGAQQAVRTGARIAATTTPVSTTVTNMTGLSNRVSTGEAFPDYNIRCDDKSQSCTQGQYNRQAMRRIIFGPDSDGACAATSRARRGMCDVFNDTKRARVEVSYIGSGLGRAGFQGDAAPLVSVKLSEVPINFVFLDMIGLDDIAYLPPIEATLMGEDLRNG